MRRLVHAAGLRYRVDYAPMATERRRRADIVFTRAKVAVFIDGCFWHGCPQHYQPSKSNVEYWIPKIDANRKRDEQVNALLVEAGWTVLRFWEHENAGAVATRIVETVRRGESVDFRQH